MSNYNQTLQSNNTDLQAILNSINELPEAGGVELPTLTNEGTASDLLSGKELIDSEGNIVTGTIPTKTSLHLLVQGSKITVPSGYYADQATMSVVTAEQAIPTINVDATGKITAVVSQDKGFVDGGTKSATEQLSTQPATVFTPTTTDQTIAAELYTTGVQTIKGDENLVAENIVAGKSIFGVEGIASGSSNGEYMTIYNSDTDGNFEIVINGTYCLSDETTMVPIWDSLGMLLVYNSNELPIEDIYYTYEYEGDDGEMITEECHCSYLTHESWISYGLIDLVSGYETVLHIIYSE